MNLTRLLVPLILPLLVASASAASITDALAGNLVTVKDKTLAPLSTQATSGAKFYAFYYSAKWCPPCRAFTPELVEAYKAIKAGHPEFELVFVSSDRTGDAMLDYMASYGMTFPAVNFEQRRSIAALKRPSHENGIPNLVFMSADGKELSTSFSPDGDYVGPRKVLADIKKHFGL
jgi:nucleoredoxin